MIIEKLKELSEEKYQKFSANLVPTLSRNTVLGVRVPMLRNLAKKVKDSDEAKAFLKQLPHTYLEENHLHAFLIEQIKDYDECIIALDEFLPYIDNWATCDSLKAKCFKKNKQRLLVDIQRWIQSDLVYTARFAIEQLMNLYLDEDYDSIYMKWVADVSLDDYYIKMMVAWYFATALAKQYEDAIIYLEENRLDKDTHNKTIQKAIESYRISDEKKQYLKSLKRK